MHGGNNSVIFVLKEFSAFCAFVSLWAGSWSGREAAAMWVGLRAGNICSSRFLDNA